MAHVFRPRGNGSLGISSLRLLYTNAHTVQKSHTVKDFDDIPGPWGLPWLGSVHKYILGGGVENMLILQQRQHQEYGPIFKEQMLGRTFVHIMDPQEIEKLCRSEGHYTIRGPILEAWTTYRKRKKECLGVFLSDGDEWRRYRQALAPKMLRPPELEANLPTLNQVAEDALDHLAAKRHEAGGDDQGEVDDLEGEILKWTSESVGSLMLDARLGFYEEPMSDVAVKFMQAVEHFLDSMCKLETRYDRIVYKYVNTPAWNKFAGALDTFMEIGQEFIDKKLNEIKAGIDSGAFDDGKYESILTYGLSKSDLTLEELCVVATEPFMAGVDTTSCSVLWLMYELARNEKVQERLHDEVSNVLGKERDVTPETIKELRYMKACLKESLRLKPVLFVIPRVLAQDMVLGGYHVPAETIVFMSVYASGQCEDHFEDAREFKPERWLREVGIKHHPFASLPFGTGRRMCLGRRIAELEISVLLAKMIQRFKLEYHHEPLRPVFKTVTMPDKPLRLKFVDRT